MITLAMVSAYKNLVIGLYQDDQLLDGIALEAFKKQSEMIFVELEKLLKKNDLTYHDLGQIVITDGPGSYTGVRIAMTIAKVLASQLHIPLAVLSTMQLYAGPQGKWNVILDARGKRVYAAHVENGCLSEPETILPLDELPAWLQSHEGILAGDTYLLEAEAKPVDYLNNFIQLKPWWRPVENVHALTPRYLKESDAYKA